MVNIKDMIVEVVNFLRVHGKSVQISSEDLEKPQTHRIWPVYNWFVQNLTGCPEMSLSQPLFSNVDAFEIREMHDLSATMLTLCLSIDNLLNDTGSPDGFYITDFIYPRKGKTVRVLYHFVGFYLSERSRHKFVAESLARIDDNAKEYGQLQIEKDDLTERIANARVRLAECQPVLKQLKEERDELAGILKNKKAEMVTSGANSKNIDDELERLKADNIRLTEEHDELKIERDYLDAQIVTSPEKLAKRLDVLEKEKTDLANTVTDMDAQVAAANDQKVKLSDQESLINSFSLPLQEIAKEYERLTTLRHEEQQLNGKRLATHSLLETVIRKTAAKRNALKGREPQLQSLRQQKEKRVGDIKKHMGQLQHDIDTITREVRRDKTTASEITEQIEKARKQMKKVENEHFIHENSIRASYADLKEKMEERQQSFKNFFMKLNADMDDEERKLTE